MANQSRMKYEIVLVPFPFDDLSANKVRPAVCLTDQIRPFGHIIVAFITSNVSPVISPTDLILDSSAADFSQTGLKLSDTQQQDVARRLRILFDL